MIVDCALYEDGRRKGGDLALEEACEASLADRAFVWIGLHEPSSDEFDSVTREFNLHELAVEDAINAHQRPKLERYDDTLFVVLKTLRHHADEDRLEEGEILLFLGPNFIISVRHGEVSALGEVRSVIEGRPDLLESGPGAVLHAIVDRVVDDYEPIAESLGEEVETVEREVFSPQRVNLTERIYVLKREVMELHRDTAALVGPMDQLARGSHDHIRSETQAYFRDVHDHLVRLVGTVEGLRDLLTSALQAHLTQVGIRQNQDMRKISAWVAIIATPTMIAGIYGMNFEHMPELKWTFGYPLAVFVMVAVCAVLYARFRRAGWL